MTARISTRHALIVGAVSLALLLACAVAPMLYVSTVVDHMGLGISLIVNGEWHATINIGLLPWLTFGGI